MQEEEYKEKRQPTHGDVVIYHDEVGTEHNAILTCGAFEQSSIYPTGWVNVLYVSDDASKRDNYGRQIERQSSVSHVSQTTAWGRYWRWPEEEANKR